MTAEDVVRCDLMTPWRHYHHGLGWYEDRLTELLNGYAWQCTGFLADEEVPTYFLQEARRYAALARAAHNLIIASWDAGR
jgi:hypothetical protein